MAKNDKSEKCHMSNLLYPDALRKKQDNSVNNKKEKLPFEESADFMSLFFSVFADLFPGLSSSRL